MNKTPRYKKAIRLAKLYAAALNHDTLGTQHLLLGLLEENEGIASQVLFSLGVDIDKAIRATRNLMKCDSDA